MSRALILPQKPYEQVQCMLQAFFFVWYHDVMIKTHGPWRQATVEPCLRKAATKVMRPRSDRGSRCTDKDQSEETED